MAMEDGQLHLVRLIQIITNLYVPALISIYYCLNLRVKLNFKLIVLTSVASGTKHLKI